MSEFKVQVLEEWKKELESKKDGYQKEIDKALIKVRELDIKSLIAERAKARYHSAGVLEEEYVAPLFAELNKAREASKIIQEKNKVEIRKLQAIITQIDFELEFLKVV